MIKVGEKYHHLTVISVAQNQYVCRCDCGNTITIDKAWKVKTQYRTCGCLYGCRKHGWSRTLLYKTWHNIRSRCKNPKATKYKYYGGKGIGVCEEWDNSFIAFKDWSLSNGYKVGLTIDRIDSNKDYSPDNCRWVDYKTQNNNLSNNHLITYNGETHSVYDWASRLNMKQNTLAERIRRGWSVERALTYPVKHKKGVCL